MSEVFAYGIVPGTEGVELPLMGKLTNFDSVSQHIRQNKNVPLRGRIGGEGWIRIVPIRGNSRTLTVFHNPSDITKTSPYGDALAEREGFEPSNPFGLHTFQACALGQTTRPLQFERLELYRIFWGWSRFRPDSLCYKTRGSNNPHLPAARYRISRIRSS